MPSKQLANPEVVSVKPVDFSAGRNAVAEYNRQYEDMVDFMSNIHSSNGRLKRSLTFDETLDVLTFSLNGKMATQYDGQMRRIVEPIEIGDSFDYQWAQCNSDLSVSFERDLEKSSMRKEIDSKVSDLESRIVSNDTGYSDLNYGD